MKCIYKNKLQRNDRASLEINRLPGLIVEIVQFQHRRINKDGHLREQPLQHTEKRWVVECPFGSFLGSRCQSHISQYKDK